MVKPRISLEYFYVTRTSLVSEPVDDDAANRGEPRLEYEAHIFNKNNFFVIARAQWGEESITPYFIDVEVHGSFNVDVEDVLQSLDKEAARGIYAKLATNSAQILHASLRGHIATITAAGPHGIWFLPTTIIDSEDVRIFVPDNFSILEDDQDNRNKKKQGAKKKK